MSPVSRKQYKSTPDKQPERLPAINYSILKEGVLRKKLKDLGIPNSGPRPLLQKRHTEWMNLWNANCDSKFPKPKRDLLRELDAWERTQGGNANSSSLEATNTVMGKSFDAGAWSNSHDDDFKRLIANARKKSDAVHKKTPQAPAASDEPQRAPIPEQPMERPIVISEMPRPEGSLVESSVNNVETQAQSRQNGSINVPPGLP